jgi:hypothetical protein
VAYSWPLSSGAKANLDFPNGEPTQKQLDMMMAQLKIMREDCARPDLTEELMRGVVEGGE